MIIHQFYFNFQVISRASFTLNQSKKLKEHPTRVLNVRQIIRKPGQARLNKAQIPSRPRQKLLTASPGISPISLTSGIQSSVRIPENTLSPSLSLHPLSSTPRQTGGKKRNLPPDPGADAPPRHQRMGVINK